MPTVHCLNCAVPFELPIEYNEYEGNVLCPSCKHMHLMSFISGRIKKQELLVTEVLHRKVIEEVPDAPDDINSDLWEAQICVSVNAHKATVVMCRRVLEQLCDDQGAQGNTLYEKISDLQSRGSISETDEKLFNTIRYFGNYGAHPTQDLLGEVSKKDSDLVLGVTIHLVRHIYEIPKIIETLEKRRQETN